MPVVANVLSKINDVALSGRRILTGTSDERLKTIHSELDGVLEAIETLRCVRFNFKTDLDADVFGNCCDKQRIGFIAQDVQAHFPEVVNVGDDDDKTLGVAYTEMIPVLCQGIKELSKENRELKTRLDSIEARLLEPKPAESLNV